MKKILLPLILLLVGLGGGVGAGLFLAPPAAPDAAETEAMPEGGEMTPSDPSESAQAPAQSPAEDQAAESGEATGPVYVQLDNQFIAPVMDGGTVAAMMILSISVETDAASQDSVLAAEPRLRDAFLQVLFNHANTGGFEGNYTANGPMRTLRAALLAAAQDSVGPVVSGVLITNIVRQDV